MLPKVTFTICMIVAHSRWYRTDECNFFCFVSPVFIAQAVRALRLLDGYEGVQFIFVHGWVCCCCCDESDNRQHVFVGRFRILANRNAPRYNTRYTLNNLSSLINHPRFDAKRKTVLYCHGMPISCSSRMIFEWIENLVLSSRFQDGLTISDPRALNWSANRTSNETTTTSWCLTGVNTRSASFIRPSSAHPSFRGSPANRWWNYFDLV